MDRTTVSPIEQTKFRVLRRRAGRFATALLGLVLAAALAPSVAAAGPIVEPLADGGTEVVECQGFDALFSRTFTGRIFIFLNGAGDPTTIQVIAHMTGSLENLSTGDILPLSGAVTVTIDLVTGTTAFTGKVLMGTRSGDGSVLKDVGRFVVNAADEIVLWAGPHDLIAGGPEALCAAVA